MSVNEWFIFKYSCDVCGQKAEVVRDVPVAQEPDGWRCYPWGDFCNECKVELCPECGSRIIGAYDVQHGGDKHVGRLRDGKDVWVVFP